jgi:hypothetical protein
MLIGNTLLAKQTKWMNAATDLQTLQSECCPTMSILNMWAEIQWIYRQKPIPCYIPFDADPSLQSNITECHTLYQDRPVPFAPVITLLHNGYQVLVAIFNPDKDECHIIGSGSTTHRAKAMGEAISELAKTSWNRISALMAWPPDRRFKTTRILYWEDKRCNLDSGVTALQVIDHLWSHGFETDKDQYWMRPILPCHHKTRYQISKDIYSTLQDLFEIKSDPQAQHFQKTIMNQLDSHFMLTMDRYCTCCVSTHKDGRQDGHTANIAATSSFGNFLKKYLLNLNLLKALEHLIQEYKNSPCFRTFQLTSLLPYTRISVELIEFFLTLEWNLFGQPRYKFFSNRYQHILDSGPGPIISLLELDSGTYAVQVFDPQDALVHIIGAAPLACQHKCPNMKALELCERISQHFGWEINYYSIQWHTVQWDIPEDHQAYLTESLIIACQITFHIWKYGFHTCKDEFWVRPPYLGCTHEMRKIILLTLEAYIKPYSPWNNAEYHLVLQRLDEEADCCSQSHRESLIEEQNEENMPFTSLPTSAGSIGNRIAKIHCAKGARKMFQPKILHHSQSSGPRISNQKIHEKSADTIVNLTNYGSYDDYYNGPDITFLESYDRTRIAFETNKVYSIFNRSMHSGDIGWRDWGYRISPDFTCAFKAGQANFVEEHMLPPEVEDLPLPQPGPIPQNAQNVGPYELVQICQNTNGKNKDAILDGIICHEGRPPDFAILDLQREAVPVAKVKAVVDFDSLIWVTRNPRFLADVNVFWSPQIRSTAAIAKDNHVSITLILPRPDEDTNERWSQKFSLSRLPHIIFGRIDDFSLMLFFPRMAHQKQVGQKRFWQTLLPKSELEIFYSQVVYPAAKQVQPPSYMVYAPTDENQRTYKARGHDYQKKPFSPSAFVALCEAMNKLVRDMRYLAVISP